MKKVLLSILSVVALNAATCTDDSNETTRNIHLGSVHEYNYIRRECPPGPTKNHPVVEWCHATNQWLRYNKNTGQWDRMPTKAD